MFAFLEEDGVSPALLRDIQRFREGRVLAPALKARVPAPLFHYYGKEIWEHAAAALLCGKNLLLAGGKATGKNVLAENLAMAFGRPVWNISFHVNADAGSLRRWYGAEMPRTLFGAWAGDRRQELLDGLCWLALESAVYRRELPERPVLAELRRAHALDFFDQEQTLSRQEWMAKNQLLYAMQSARWRAALGRQSPVLTPYEKKLSHALDCGALDGETLARTVLDIFQRFRLFHGTLKTPSALLLHLDGTLAALALKLRPSEIRHPDMISVSTGRTGAGGTAPDLRRGRLRLNENAETDRDYIESCFGPPLLPQRELELLEQNLCTGVHFGCRLWLSSGVPDAARAKRRETRYLIQQSALQCQRNRAAYAWDSALYQSMIAQLTGRIRDCLQTYSQNDWEPARGGRLNASRTWRGAVLGEDRIFDRETASLLPGLFRGAAAGRVLLPSALSGDRRRPGLYPIREPEPLRHSGAGVRLLQRSGLYGSPGV